MPADLHKQSSDTVSPFEKLEMNLEAWVNAHAPILFILSLLLLVFFVVALIMAITGVQAYQLTGTEANIHYNHLGDII
jgi:hypothetical protein